MYIYSGITKAADPYNKGAAERVEPLSTYEDHVRQAAGCGAPGVSTAALLGDGARRLRKALAGKLRFSCRGPR